MTEEKALAMLREGNRRFVEGRLVHPRQTPERRLEIAGAQRPFASVLACADSRVPPEILFDQGLGDLFVVRVAGNVADGAVFESLELSAAHLRLPVIVVLGHTKCGAITAAVSGEAEAGGLARSIVDLLRPAVDEARGGEGDPVTLAAFANVRMTVEKLRRSRPVLSDLQEREGLRIVGAVYDTGTGEVAWLDD